MFRKSFQLGSKRIKIGVVALFIVIFGGFGVTLQFFSHAASAYGPVVLFGGYCLDNANNKAVDSNKIQLWQCLGNENQSWTVNGSPSTSGTIMNQNGYCLGLDSSTNNYTDVILYHCDGLTTQQWFYDAQTGQIVNKDSGTCMDDYHTGHTNGNQIDIYSCNGSTAQNWLWEPPTCPSGDTGTYPNCVAPKCPSGDTGTYPNCVAPKCPSGDTGTYPNCVAPKCPSGDTGTYPNCVAPKCPSGDTGTYPNCVAPPPKSNGGGSSGSSGGSSGSTLGVTSTPTTSQPSNGSTAQSSSNPTSTLNTTITNNPEPTITLTGKPSISNVEATHITGNSITITWQASDASKYIIKYGLTSSNLPVTKTLTTNDAVPIVTLSSLPTGKIIYIQITPSNGSLNGATKLVDFKTTGSGGSKAGAFIASVLIGIAIAFVFIMFKRKRAGGGNQPYSVDLDAANLPIYPREDTATEASRLNWWMPDEQRQHAANPQPQHKPGYDEPDMFEEGRKRLDDEEKHHKLPGS